MKSAGTGHGDHRLRIALAQINPTVGDLAGNRALIRANLVEAKSAGAHVVVFPEMILTGYPVEDLATRPSFQSASIEAVGQLAKDIATDGCADLVAVVGYLDRINGAPQNAIALIQGGEIKARYSKRHLPNYGVFDEYRNFVSGDGTLVARVHGIDIGFAICEDIWQDGGMLADLAKRTPGLVLVPNGSPFERKKDGVRLSLVQKRAKEVGAPFAYVNMTGGQDDLVFDGDTIVFINDGDDVWELKESFQSGFHAIGSVNLSQVFMRNKELGDVQAVITQKVFIGMHEVSLTNSSQGLERRHVGRSGFHFQWLQT
jgi:NAD+ synthase (glutamine-hydrolysing)